MSAPASRNFILKGGHQPRAGGLVKRADMVRQQVGEGHSLGIRPAGIDGRLRMGYGGQRLQLFGVIPDQAEPDADLVDKRGRWLAAASRL